RTTATPTLTGPAQAPRPTSSNPATHWWPARHNRRSWSNPGRPVAGGAREVTTASRYRGLPTAQRGDQYCRHSGTDPPLTSATVPLAAPVPLAAAAPLAAAGGHHSYSASSLVVFGVIIVVGYLMIVRRRGRNGGGPGDDRGGLGGLFGGNPWKKDGDGGGPGYGRGVGRSADRDRGDRPAPPPTPPPVSPPSPVPPAP